MDCLSGWLRGVIGWSGWWCEVDEVDGGWDG